MILFRSVTDIINYTPKSRFVLRLTFEANDDGNYVAITGVWFMHCHLEIHTSWGLKMAWLVLDGKLPNQKLLPPPADLPKC
jgi:hypothetical protein